MPGEPKFQLEDMILSICSIYQDVRYELITTTAILNKENFVDLSNELPNVEITILESSQSSVHYLVDIRFKTEEGVSDACRIYATSNSLYWLIVSGNDLSLADDFFNSVKIEEQ